MRAPDFALPPGHPAPDRRDIAVPLQAGPGRGTSLIAQAIRGSLSTAWNLSRTITSGWLLQPKRQRRLRVSETVSLGEKRFVSIVELDGQAFLIGGGTAGVSLLAELSPAPEQRTFRETASEAWRNAETA